MIQRIITKYGLATHLALLAAVPFAVHIFLGPFVAALVAACLSFFAVEWFLLEPSIHSGEDFDDARQRVLSSLVRDPLLYFFAIAILFALARALNGGLTTVYDVETQVWSVSQPAIPFLPASSGDDGFILFSAVLALAVVVLCVRHGLGHAARTSCLLTGSCVAGVAGLVAAAAACCGNAALIDLASRGFQSIVFSGDVFGLWLLASVASAGMVEDQNWSRAGRPAVFIALAGNTVGLIFFAPPPVAVLYLVLSFVFAAFVLFFVGNRVSFPASVRVLTIGAVAVGLAVMCLVILAPEHVRSVKTAGILPATSLPATFWDVRSALSRLSREMWVAHPWCGVGAGAFGLNVPFVAVQADWAILPPRPEFVADGYLMLLAERGILGCGLLLAGVLLMVTSYVVRFGHGLRALRGESESPSPAFGFPLFVWAAPLMVVAVLTEAFFAASPFIAQPAMLVLALVLAVSTVSFPRVPVHPVLAPAVPAPSTVSSEK